MLTIVETFMATLKAKSIIITGLLTFTTLCSNSPKSSGQTIVVQSNQEYKALTYAYRIPQSFQGKVVREIEVSKEDKVTALTFDDGPWPTTLKILNILNQSQVKATFFLIGLHLSYYPRIAQKVVEGGHAIGNHSWHHFYRQLKPQLAKEELDDTATLIYKVTGIKTPLFRPPGGYLDNGLADYAKKNGYVVILWSVFALEPESGTSQRSMVDTILRTVQPGSIILLHDGGGKHVQTVKALPLVIAGLKKKGYRFATIPELLELKNKD
jgi:peptidoglycan-N-acetylglucosamine deacetylase